MTVISDNTPESLRATDLSDAYVGSAGELLCDHDPAQKEKLADEISILRGEGYDIVVGKTSDYAYLQPDSITYVFQDLQKKEIEFSNAKSADTARSIGAVSMAHGDTITPERLEAIRAEILFDEFKMPWHLQRGSALALQTIVDAHDLVAFDNVSDDHGYPTVSGSLPYFDKGYVFESADNSLSGMDLATAMTVARQRDFGCEHGEASEYTDASLARLEKFFNTPVTQEFKNVVAYCYDSLGIRSRKQEVQRAIDEHIDEMIKVDPEKTDCNILSVGCGTAQAILEEACKIKEKGLNPTVILLDQDPIALAVAKQLADQMGVGDNIEIHCERLFNGMRPLNLDPIIKGRQLDVAEDTGLREYLPDRMYKSLTTKVWGHLTKGGIMTSGNMNVNRPQPEFLHGLMGWEPRVQMRTIQRGLQLHEQSGVEKGKTRAVVTQDGVYTLFFSYK